MNEEIAFLSYLREHPDDLTARGAYADWLDEHRRGIEAQILRGDLQPIQVEGIARLPSLWGVPDRPGAYRASIPLAPFARCLARVQSGDNRDYRVTHFSAIVRGQLDVWGYYKVSLIVRADGAAYALADVATGDFWDMSSFYLSGDTALEFWSYSREPVSLDISVNVEPRK